TSLSVSQRVAHTASATALRASNKFRRERAINTVAKGQAMFLRFQAQGWRFSDDATNDLFILFGLKAARAVNNDTAWLQQPKHSADDRGLRTHARAADRDHPRCASVVEARRWHCLQHVQP